MEEVDGELMHLGDRYRLATRERLEGAVLGRGRHGKVFLMFNSLGVAVAVKWLPRGDGIDASVRREVLRHHSLPAHPNVIKFLEAFVTDTHLAIVLEYAEAGQLLTHLRTGRPCSEARAQYYFRQLTTGVTHLHENRLCHRDIKLQNVLLGQYCKEACVKIGDFGFVKCDKMDSKAKTKCGTLAFCAPEVLMRAATDTAPYDGKAADVWSCGVCLFVMVTGTLPFTDGRNSQADTIKRIIQMDWGADGPAAAFLSDGLRDLLARIFQADPAARPTIKELSAHAWMQGTIVQDDGDYWHPQLTGVMEPPAQTAEQLEALIEEARRLAVPLPHHFNEEEGGLLAMEELTSQRRYPDY